MRTVAAIQARMGSTRLPGKALADLCGRPVLERVVTRVQRSKEINEIVVATSVRPENDAIAVLCAHLGIRCIRGSEQDVLSRYMLAAKETNAEVVARITADCPLIDPSVVDQVIRGLNIGRFDFCSNAIRRTYPRGLDVEVAWRDTLERVNRLATSQPAREHVFTYIYLEDPKLFLSKDICDREDNSALNWCVDTAADLEYMRRIYDDEADYKTLIERVRRMAA